jgi:N-acetylglucosaminyldiphosphoundecaprenol N-acetyl-beta-D-mannosaminyltransferase
MKVRILSFAKINFFEADYNYIIKLLIKKRGYLVMPAASSLVNIDKDKEYKIALEKSTAALLDSGFFCIILLIKKFKFFEKFSGYRFIDQFLKDNSMKYKKILSLDPSTKSSKINNKFLKSKKFKFIKNYACPKYSVTRVKDINLLKIINKYKPDIIISNIGGGIQEKLAFYISQNIKNQIIICSGAAISFFTGEQARITPIVDRLYLGWLKRFFFDPTKFYKRINNSFYLFNKVNRNNVKVLYR